MGWAACNVALVCRAELKARAWKPHTPHHSRRPEPSRIRSDGAVPTRASRAGRQQAWSCSRACRAWTAAGSHGHVRAAVAVRDMRARCAPDWGNQRRLGRPDHTGRYAAKRAPPQRRYRLMLLRRTRREHVQRSTSVQHLRSTERACQHLSSACQTKAVERARTDGVGSKSPPASGQEGSHLVATPEASISGLGFRRKSHLRSFGGAGGGSLVSVKVIVHSARRRPKWPLLSIVPHYCDP